MAEVNPRLIAPGARSASVRRFGPTAPQAGVPAPDVVDRFPRAMQSSRPAMWWFGVHGGAGESTLAALVERSRAADHAWPIPQRATGPSRVALVARTNWTGLIAAQRAATEWASGALGGSVELMGLVLMSDVPGRVPKQIRELVQVISGGVPQVWTLPFVDQWRIGPPVAGQPVRAGLGALLADLQLTQAVPL